MNDERCEVNLDLEQDHIRASWTFAVADASAKHSRRTIQLTELSFVEALRDRKAERKILEQAPQNQANASDRARIAACSIRSKHWADSEAIPVAMSISPLALAEAQRISLGSQLFLAMMPNETTRAQLLEFIDSHERVSLWLRLHPDLEVFPWELARDPDLGWLALVPGISVVRLGQGESPPQPHADSMPIRIGHVDAGDVLAGRELREERWPGDKEISEALVPWGVRKRSQVRYGQVRTALTASEPSPNVFHFTGHGDPPSDPLLGDQDSTLVFRKPEGGSNPIGLAEIGHDLKEAGVQLAVLAACRAGTDSGWRGLGAGLLDFIPAAVSMQAEVHDDGAEEFSAELYRQLGRGIPLDQAVAAARRRAYEQGKVTVDWWVPVLHYAGSYPMQFTPHPAFTRPDATKVRPVLAHPYDALPLGADGAERWHVPQNPIVTRGPILASPDGRLVGTRTEDGVVLSFRHIPSWRWQYRVPILDDEHLIALHATETAVRILVTSPRSTRTIRVDTRRDGNGHLTEQEDRGAAVSGAWIGSRFAWCYEDGTVVGLENWEPGVPSTSLLDVATGSHVTMAAWAEDSVLVLRRSDENGQEERRVDTTRRPERVVVARCDDGSPAAAFIAVADDGLVGWTWDTLG